MAKLITNTITYKDKEYTVAVIPDVFSGGNQEIHIGSHSLNEAVYSNEKGYVDEVARSIDEQIYAYIDDDYFSLSLEDFLQKVKLYLD